MSDMNISAKHLWILVLALAGLFPSCEFSDSSDDYSITPMVICNGGDASNNFTVEYYVDNEFIITDTQESADNTMSELPLGKRGIVTVTATREDETSSMTILIYKNNKMDKFSNLASCSSSTYTSCSNTLVVYYDVDDETNLTKSAATDSDSDDDSDSSSSGSTGSSGSSSE